MYASGIVVAADTGYSSDANNAWLKEACINACIPDNQFRFRDPKFRDQKTKQGKRRQDKVVGIQAVMPLAHCGDYAKGFG